jgi:membrane protein YdbS with pleckstrin-like domain
MSLSQDLTMRPPTHMVSRRAIGFWTVRALLPWLVIVGVQVAFVFTSHHSTVRLVVLAISVVVALTHLIVMPQWRYRVHRWEATDTAVYTQSGWFNQERRIAPISRIQTIDSERGPIEQIFRLTNVTVTTASAAGPLKIKGLDRAQAEALIDELQRRTRDFRGDAT